jgi:putative FmdB family regulatory protein
MPIYEYKCDSCGKTFEKIEKFSDAPLETHEGCGGAVERLLSAPAFQFKGTGWYVTDYARSNGGNGKNEAKNDSKSDSKNESKRESSSESKSESKSDSSSSSSSKSSDSGGSANSSSTTSSSSTSSDKK